MTLLRSHRFPAIILLAAAAVGLIVANSAAAGGADAVMRLTLGIPGVFEISVSHLIKDGLLAIFFFVVAVELRHELTAGELNSMRKATPPAIAAAGGIIVPIVVFLLFAAGTDSASGWPVPTATDIAFALGVLAVFGRGLPSALRVFLLALAILDDIVGIVFIAVLFTSGVDLVMLLLAGAGVALFGLLSRRVGAGSSWPLRAGLVMIAVLTWVLVYASGVHATIAGVALGLVMARRPAQRVRHTLEPWVNGAVLPLFAFSAALVQIPPVAPADLQPAFWGVAVALPLGKIIGISLFGWIAVRVGRDKGAAPSLPFPDLLAAGALSGIGFTVSLLLGELAFADDALLRDETILGVLTGSGIALVLASVLVSLRSAHYRREVRASDTSPSSVFEREARS